MKKKTILITTISFVFIGILFATTWYDVKVNCPVCNQENTFQQISSYGSYIYQWPSKYQYIYWPVTETYSVYTCKHCYYSALMWDFESVSGDTLKKIKSALDGVHIELAAKKNYLEIPVSKKVELAEITYRSYQKDLDFWCNFYRIQGYHYEKENNNEKAKVSRLKALGIAKELLADSANYYRKKELLLITGAMKYYANSDSFAAINDFNKAKLYIYADPLSDSSNNSGLNNYLDMLLVDYIHMISDSIK